MSKLSKVKRQQYAGSAKLKNYELPVWQNYRTHILVKWEVTIVSALIMVNVEE